MSLLVNDTYVSCWSGVYLLSRDTARRASSPGEGHRFQASRAGTSLPYTTPGSRAIYTKAPEGSPHGACMTFSSARALEPRSASESCTRIFGPLSAPGCSEECSQLDVRLVYHVQRASSSPPDHWERAVRVLRLSPFDCWL